VFWPWGSTKNGLSKTGGNVDGGTSLLYAEDLNVLGTLLGALRAFLVRQRGRERKGMVPAEDTGPIVAVLTSAFYKSKVSVMSMRDMERA
jgi:hypothetical protein